MDDDRQYLVLHQKVEGAMREKKSPYLGGGLLHFVLTLALIAGFFSVTAPVRGATIGATILVTSKIDSLANDGVCTLREAVISANKNASSGSKPKECPAGSSTGIDRIVLPNNLGTFTLTRTDNGKEDASATGDLDILGSVIIEGSGPGVTIVGTSGDRVFHVLSGDVTIQKLTIKTGNHNGDGGGIYNAAKLSLFGVTLTGNQAGGGGAGGGIYNASGATLTMVNSTISGNAADGDGGGLFNLGAATLNNVTITANNADSNADGSGDGGGLAVGGGSFTVSNTIVAGNNDKSPGTKQLDCAGNLVSAGYNLIQSTVGCSGYTATDQTGQDPKLGTLQDNGGYTITHALLDGSPAIDAGNPAIPGSRANACETTDQRGTYRPHGKSCDIGAVEAGSPNASVLIRAFSGTNTTTVVGRLDSAPNTTFTLQLLTGTDPTALCSVTGTGTPVGSPIQVTTDALGNAIFQSTVSILVPRGQLLVATTTDPGGFTSGYSPCVRIGAGNDSWPNALELFTQASPNGGASVDDFIDLTGQSRWFKFQVEPGSRVIVTLTDLPANYDLTIYKDIGAAFKAIGSSKDLLHLGAEFAPEAFTPDEFAADVFSPEAFTPEAFTPEAFTPEAFTPEAFTPEAFTPEAFTPEAFTPEAFTPDAFTPEAFTPEAFTPEAFTPEAFTPEAFTPEAFTSAQTRSLIGVSAFDGLVGEGIRINTWDNHGYFYVRVRGRNGAFDPQKPFHLDIRQTTGVCAGVNPDVLPPSNLSASGPGFKTIILTNPMRMQGTPELASALQAFAARPEVAGAVVDVSQDARVAAAYSQFDTYAACPSAGNLVAEAIKGIVDQYRLLNPGLQYIVIVGNDSVIPFFRHPDHSMLASEKNYTPPVLDRTTSQASLKLGYVLSQDDYGAGTQVSYKDDQFPIPSLAIGRLVETPSDALAVLNAYLSIPSGGVITPTTALVTGYDFLADVAGEVDASLTAGLGNGGTVDTLIAPQDQAPTDPNAWTADNLRAVLLGQRHDLVFLAGHFSANGALAADYTTRLTASELAASSVDLSNSVIYSAGCHAGYNIVNPHGVPAVTREPDWAQAFASKGATLVAGTGYQYGDTDFIRYSERLYQLFTDQLRTGSGPVSVGKALAAAKRAYITETPYLRGIDEKSVLEATLFGLPMLSVNLPGARITPTAQPSVVTPPLAGYAANPGASLGLQFKDITVSPVTTPTDVQLDNISDASVTTATYLEGPDGVVVKSNEPVLPLDNVNVSFPGTVLRGVGFRSGSFTDIQNVFALTGASATEVRGVHLPFLTNVFYPTRPWTINYFDALANETGGVTQLSVMPAQYISNTPSSPTGTLRRFDQMQFRLFYSNNVQTYAGGSTPALAAAPTIAIVSSSISTSGVTFRMRVVGNPAAGIQEVWITYTDVSQTPVGQWISVDLSRDPNDSTAWIGFLPLNGASADNLRYFIQAANGVGLVSMDTNQGRYYVPGAEAGPTQPTTLTLMPTPPETQIPASGRYSTPVALTAQLTSNGAPLAGKAVAFVLGPQSRLAITNADGVATATISAFGLPGDSEVRASFAGAGDYQASFDTEPFNILKQVTKISLDPQDPSGYPPETTLVTATLTDVDGRRLGEETLFFIVSGPGGSYSEAVITDYAGRARLGNIPLPPGTYQLDVYFSGDIQPLGLSLSDDRYEPYATRGTLTLLNHPPQVTADAYTVDEDQTLTVPAPGVLGNDSDADGHSLIAQLVTGTSHGSLTLNADGSFTYLPDANFNGSDSFTYAAYDGFDTSNATVSITVNPVNDAPVAVADVYSVKLNTPLSVSAPGVLGNDSDIEGDALQAVLVSGPSNGSLTLNPDGSFVYTPNTDFFGRDSFTYKANDGVLDSGVVTVTLYVTEPSPDSLWPPNGGFVTVSVLGAIDPSGAPLSITITGVKQDEPVGSSPDAIIQGSTVQLRAERDGNGDGRVYHIFFVISDGKGGSCAGEVLLGVVPHDQGSNLAPIDGGALYDSTVPQ